MSYGEMVNEIVRLGADRDRYLGKAEAWLADVEMARGSNQKYTENTLRASLAASQIAAVYQARIDEKKRERAEATR